MTNTKRWIISLMIIYFLVEGYPALVSHPNWQGGLEVLFGLLFSAGIGFAIGKGLEYRKQRKSKSAEGAARAHLGSGP